MSLSSRRRKRIQSDPRRGPGGGLGEGGDLDLTSTVGDGIYAGDGDLVFSGGSLSIDAADNKMTVSGGKITAEASSDGPEGDFIVISGGYVMGGTAVLPDKTVNKVFAKN